MYHTTNISQTLIPRDLKPPSLKSRIENRVDGTHSCHSLSSLRFRPPLRHPTRLREHAWDRVVYLSFRRRVWCNRSGFGTVWTNVVQLIRHRISIFIYFRCLQCRSQHLDFSQVPVPPHKCWETRSRFYSPWVGVQDLGCRSQTWHAKQTFFSPDPASRCSPDSARCECRLQVRRESWKRSHPPVVIAVRWFGDHVFFNFRKAGLHLNTKSKHTVRLVGWGESVPYSTETSTSQKKQLRTPKGSSCRQRLLRILILPSPCVLKNK